MKRPPAFQFYADDFLGGTQHLTDAEVGLYIRLLCAQWNSGGLPNDDAELASYGKAGKDGTRVDRVKSKFQLQEDGQLQNARLEAERGKQKDFRERQTKNGRNGAAKRWLPDSEPTTDQSQMTAPTETDNLVPITPNNTIQNGGAIFSPSPEHGTAIKNAWPEHSSPVSSLRLLNSHTHTHTHTGAPGVRETQPEAVPVPTVQAVDSPPVTGLNAFPTTVLPAPAPPLAGGHAGFVSPSLRDVLDYAAGHGVSPESATRFFHHHDDNSLWINQHGRHIQWQSKLVTWQQQDRARAQSAAKTASPKPRTHTGPTLAEVAEAVFAKVGKRPETQAWAASWYNFWSGKKWLRRGFPMDWASELQVELAKHFRDSIG